MFELITHSPIKMTILFTFFVAFLVYILMNMNNPKKLYFLVVFYIPLSFKSLSGSLAVYLIIFIYILSLFHTEKSKERYIGTGNIDRLLIGLIFLFSLFSLVTTDMGTLTYFSHGRIRLTPDFLDIITFLSCIALYLMTMKYIRSREDFFHLLKIMIVSATLASLSGYLQIINPENIYIFKYIVLSENVRWASRIAATMQGYEYLAEYMAVMLLLTLVVLLQSKKLKIRYVYIVLMINFIIIMTMTQVRGIYVALVLDVFYLVFLLQILGRVKSSFKILLYSIMALVLLVSSILTIDAIKPDAGFVKRFVRLENVNVEKGNYGTRTGVWDWAAKTINHMSTIEFLIGAGHKYLHAGKGDHMVTTWPHSLYLSYILRDGVLGLFVFLGFIFWLYKQSINSILRAKRLHDNELFIITVILNFMLVLIMIDEIKIEFIRHDRSQDLTWLFFALIAAFTVIVKNEYINRTSKQEEINKPSLIKNNRYIALKAGRKGH